MCWLGSNGLLKRTIWIIPKNYISTQMHFSKFVFQKICYWDWILDIWNKFKSADNYELFSDLSGTLFSKVYTLRCRWDYMSHTCFFFLLFFIAFVTNFGEIFLEYSWKYSFKIFEKVFIFKKKSSYYFIKVHVKNLLKHVIFKKIEIH